MNKLIMGASTKDGQRPERYYLPSDEAALSEGFAPERFHEKLKNVINAPKGYVGFSGYGEGEYFSFKRTDLDYYKFMEFCDAYYKQLEAVYKETPERYTFDIGVTYSAMKWTLSDGSFYKDSDTIKKTCKQLGIKHTYKAINAFMRGE